MLLVEGVNTYKPILRSSFAEPWTKFVDRLGLLDSRLTAEWESCWQDLQTILEGQAFQREAISLPTLEPPALQAVQTARMEVGQVFLLNPTSQWERQRPYQRALMALEQYDRNLKELVRTLPEAISVSGPEAVGVLSEWVSDGWRRRLARLRRQPQRLPLRAVVVSVLRKRARSRSKIEGRYLLALALALRQLRTPWAIVREALDASVMGQPLSSHEVEAEWAKMQNAIERFISQAERELSGWREASKRTAPDLARHILSDLVWRRRRKTANAQDRRIECAAHWAGQMRAVDTELRLELALEQSERQILDRFQQAVENLGAEQADLLTELDGVITWLRRQIEQDGQEGFPPPKADVVPASSRLSELEAVLKLDLESIPQPCEIRATLTALPRRRSHWLKLYPRDTLYHAFRRTGRPQIAQALQEIELEQRKIIQEIERAREVVAFGLEVTRADRDVRPEVAHEALQNALSLLEFYRQEAPDWRPAAEARLAQALAAVFWEYRLVLSRQWLGVFSYLARQGFRRAVALIGRNAVAASAKALRAALKVAEQMTLRFLVSIGWRQAPRVGKVEVITRPFLPEEITVDLSAKDLPALYRHLFRFEAIQDPRFLVGREKEMAAMADARSRWEADRPVAIIVVGERGSGKTSLLNCAVKRVLDGLEVIRGEFGERLVTEAQLRKRLAQLVDLDDPMHLEPFLAARPRVLMLEETERAFLRQVGHYEALRALQRLIAATCSSTLWILSINQVAFRFLDAALDLGSSFSHRINAATANRENLRQAILLRHNLSGLRLKFAPPPEQYTFVHWLKRVIHGEADPEKIFFDALARESGGVFRTAFELWLGHIETIQAGVLYMKPLSSLDLTPVIDDLDLVDLFTLVAILQHGSLTPEEHAAIFQMSVASSRAQMDELLAREIIESDPGRAGFRVRPEALRVVHEALYRRNLL